MYKLIRYCYSFKEIYFYKTIHSKTYLTKSQIQLCRKLSFGYTFECRCDSSITEKLYYNLIILTQQIQVHIEFMWCTCAHTHA